MIKQNTSETIPVKKQGKGAFPSPVPQCFDGPVCGGVAYFPIFGTYHDILSVQCFFFEHAAFGKLQSVVHFLGKVEYLFI